MRFPPPLRNHHPLKRFVCANISIKPPCAIRLPHASVGLAFTFIFSAYMVYFRTFLRQIPRKCEAWASIFVEMFALHFVPSLESQPFKISHGLSFCFLWLVSFLFLSRKKKRKKVTKKYMVLISHNIPVLNKFENSNSSTNQNLKQSFKFTQIPVLQK